MSALAKLLRLSFAVSLLFVFIVPTQAIAAPLANTDDISHDSVHDEPHASAHPETDCASVCSQNASPVSGVAVLKQTKKKKEKQPAPELYPNVEQSPHYSHPAPPAGCVFAHQEIYKHICVYLF